VQSFAVAEAVGPKLTTSAFTVGAACGSQVTGNDTPISPLPADASTLSAQACFPL
jgi:hypothetical protein